MSDLQEVIARWRKDISLCKYDTYWIDLRELTRLLDAAEAGARARDAALEEAAKVAEAVDPEKPGNWLHARHKIAFAIRALRGAA